VHDVLISVLLGIIEGLTEFLPVSSTAHLRIAQYYLGIAPEDPYWKMFAVVIQLGAVMCLPIYFYGRIMKFLRSFPKGETGDRTMLTHPLTLVLIAFACTAVPAALLKKLIDQNLENYVFIGAALVIGGAIMWAVDAVCTAPRTTEMERISLFQAIWIGSIQTLAAVFPGTSRSMATIAAGQSAGLSRSAALEFSFFLSMPTMAAACVYDLYKSLKPGQGAEVAPLIMDGQRWFVLAVGFVVSFIVALGVVAWFMHWVRKRGFVPFAIYRIVLGVVILLQFRGR
jgi:undecaprenyl-diphosphatase